ncbi:MAG: hypothetical protein EXQ63_04375 [Ilumatobacteraceae bacterium]|nr:hypothetical protein [Ilumatobacteraceae bacterium]
MASRSFALVSCAEALELDTDLGLLVQAFTDIGQRVQIVQWDDPNQDWERFDITIVRSPWDYHERYQEFLDWINRVNLLTLLLNPADVLRWNTDKRYLAELIDAGMAVIPTTFLTTQDDVAMLTYDDDLVLKPTVSAGSNNTHRFVGDAVAARMCASELVAQGHVVMVQPYQHNIDLMGETGLVYFGGQFSHAFCKGAVLGTQPRIANSLFVQEEISGTTAQADELALGLIVLEYVTSKFGSTPLYARVDIVRSADGAPALMEVELTEPSFFLHISNGSANRFAQAAWIA